MDTKNILPNFFLSEVDFKILVGKGDWQVNEIPLKMAERIKGHFGIDTSFCVLASGVSPIPAKTCPSGSAVAGIDWVRNETKPKPGETELNVYHYVILKQTVDGYPVFYFGDKETVAPHWSELEDLKVYFKAWV